MNEESRGPWYLITGLVIGLVLGFVNGWLVAPVSYIDTQPHTLRQDLKDEYRALIALSYLANGDTARAQTRLALLRDVNPAEVLSIQAQRRNAEGASEEEVRALGLLASVAGAELPDLPTQGNAGDPASPTPLEQANVTEAVDAGPTDVPTTPAEEPATPEDQPNGTPTADNQVTATATISGTQAASATGTPTRTPTPTATDIPTATPTPTPGTFILDSQQLACSTTFTGPLLIVRTLDNNGNGVPGVEIIINWPGNEEHFFTGLKPEFGLGFADFQMEPGITYTLRLADGSQLIPGLEAEQCDPGNGNLIWGTLSLTFIQP